MSNSPTLDRLYLAEPFPVPAAEQTLRELADEYHRRTEAYDRTVCTGEVRNGCILPVDRDEMSKINANAKRVSDYLYTHHVRMLGFTKQDWFNALRRSALQLS